MKRLLVIGASMPLPTDELRYEDTWIYKFCKRHPELEVVDKCVRARTAKTLMHGGPKGEAKNLFEWYMPDCIILHLGLTDCAPRLLPKGKLITKIIAHLPFSSLIYSYLKKYQGRKIEYADLSQKDFRENINGYVKKVAPVPVGIIAISKVTNTTLAKSPKFNKSIDLYNDIIKDIVKENSNSYLIEGLDATDSSLYQSDGMHLVAKGQQIILERVCSFVSTLNSTILPSPI